MTGVKQCSTRDKDLVDISQFKTAQIEAIKPPQKHKQNSATEQTQYIVHDWLVNQTLESYLLCSSLTLFQTHLCMQHRLTRMQGRKYQAACPELFASKYSLFVPDLKCFTLNASMLRFCSMLQCINSKDISDVTYCY